MAAFAPSPCRSEHALDGRWPRPESRLTELGKMSTCHSVLGYRLASGQSSANVLLWGYPLTTVYPRPSPVSTSSTNQTSLPLPTCQVCARTRTPAPSVSCLLRLPPRQRPPLLGATTSIYQSAPHQFPFLLSYLFSLPISLRSSNQELLHDLGVASANLPSIDEESLN